MVKMDGIIGWTVNSTFDHKLSRLPFLSGNERFKQFLGRNKAIALGARGTMGEGIVNSMTRGGVGTFRQDIDLEDLETSRHIVATTQAKAVKVRKMTPTQQRMVNRMGLLGPPIVFEEREPFSEISKAHEDSRFEAEHIVNSFLGRALPDDRVRNDYMGATLVVEAGPELLGFKQNVFEFFDFALKNGAVLASNTSTLRPSEIAKKVDHPENVVGLHFFKYADRNPLLEIIVTEKTSPEVIEAMRQLGYAMNKQCIVVWKDVNGAAANRILVGVLNEASNIADEGKYSPDFIDKVFLETFYCDQIHVKDPKAQTQFKEAPKLGLFKDEVGAYKAIRTIDAKITSAKQKGWKGQKEIEKLLDEKLALLKEVAGDLGQKRVYAGVVENLQVLGTFFKPSKRVAEAKEKSATQLGIVNEYLKQVRRNKEYLLNPFEIEPYVLTEREYDRGLETRGAEVEVSNRLQSAYMAIAAQLVHEDIISMHDVEIACKQGFKWNIGPFELMNKLGCKEVCKMIDEYLPSNKDIESRIRKPDYKVDASDIPGVRSYVQDGVGFVELGRLHIQNLQQTQNSLNPEMLKGIQRALVKLQEEGATGVVIKSQGGGAFSSGADLAYAQSIKDDPVKLREFVALGKEVVQFIRNYPLPTLALVDGPGVGGGAEITTACDYRIMVDEESYIAFPEVGLGLDPEWMGTEYFPEIVGKLLAKAMICNVRNPLSAPKLTASDALEVGFADAVVPRNELYSFLAEIIRGNVTGIDLTKKPVRVQNFDKTDYSDAIKKKFGITKGFRHRGGSLTKRQIARQAERFIDNSHDPTYWPKHRDEAFSEMLRKSFIRVDKLQVQPFIRQALSDKWLTPKLSIAWNLIRSIV